MDSNSTIHKITQSRYNLKNYLKDNRVGDHIWYISDMSKFKKDYPNWKQSYNTEKIIKELVNNFSF